MMVPYNPKWDPYSLLMIPHMPDQRLFMKNEGPRKGKKSVLSTTAYCSSKTQVYFRWTPHPVIVTIRDNRDYIRVLLYSSYTTIKEGGGSSYGILPKDWMFVHAAAGSGTCLPARWSPRLKIAQKPSILSP